MIGSDMKIALWSLSFLFLIGAALTGIGASIGVLTPDWFVVCLFCVAVVFSAAEIAEKNFKD